jgi:hypothetical protein
MKKLPIYLHCWLVLCICTTLGRVSKIYIYILLLFDTICFGKRKKSYDASSQFSKKDVSEKSPVTEVRGSSMNIFIQ